MHTPPLPAGPFDLILADPGLVCASPEASFVTFGVSWFTEQDTTAQ